MSKSSNAQVSKSPREQYPIGNLQLTNHNNEAVERMNKDQKAKKLGTNITSSYLTSSHRTLSHPFNQSTNNQSTNNQLNK